MKIKDKILLVFFFVLILFLLISTNSFASDITFTDRFGDSHTFPAFNVEGYSLNNGYIIKFNKYYSLFILEEDSFFTVSASDIFISQGSMYHFRLDETTNEWVYYETINARPGRVGVASEILYFATDIYDYSDNSIVIYESSSNIFGETQEEYIFPYIADNDETLMELNTDYLLLMPGSVPNTYYIDFTITKVIDSTTSEQIFTLRLDTSSSLYNELNGEYWYEVPVASFSSLLDKNSNYLYVLSGVNDVTEYNIVRDAFYVGMTEEEKLENTINNNFSALHNLLNNLSDEQKAQAQEQIDLLKQQNENDKGIIESIKEVISYINPFSENFFVYKLIDLLVDALKSLFIPADDYFSNYFNELMDWFSDRLGFLAYPLELILDILNKFLNINFSEPIVSIPDIEEPTTGLKIISATEYNLNSLLENETLKNVHDIYFIVVDAIIIFGLVNLLKHKLEEVMTK